MKQIFLKTSQAKRFFALIVFIITFLWMLFVTQGLPFVDSDDWDHVLASQDTSWKLMLTNFITPWSKTHHWVSQADLIDQTTSKRLVHGIALKLVASTFGYRPFPYYIFTKALFFAGTSLILFLLLVHVTKSSFYALVGILFFVVVPAHYLHTIWISASETMLHFFMILCLWIYMQLVSILDRREHALKFWIWLIFLLVVGWLGMKTKETAVTVPLALGAFTMVRLIRWRSQKIKAIVLMIVLIFLVFLVVPVGHLNSAGLPTNRFTWQTIHRMVFRNYATGQENEPISAFFSLADIWPVSIARTLGFFLIWTLILSFILYWIWRIKNKMKTRPRFLDHPLVGVSIFWIVSELFLMGFFQPDPRYFSGIMIPVTITGVQLIYCVRQMSPNLLKRMVALLAVGSVGWGFFTNIQHVVWWREHVGQRGNRFFNVSKSIYQDQFQKDKPTIREIGSYYSSTYVPCAPSQPRLKDVTYYVALAFDALNRTHSPSVEEFERYAKEGAIYYASDFPPEELFTHPKIKLLTSVTGINEESWFERIMYKLKNRKPQSFYIFKYNSLTPKTTHGP